MRKIYFGDNLPILRDLPSGLADLVYIDPPFNTGGWQTRTRLRTIRDDNGDRVGFQGKRYRSEPLSRSQFRDQFDDFLAFLEPRLIEIKRLLSDSGSLYFHIDYREVHYCKILLDQIFGRDCFLNEIIWAYDYGGRPKRRWPAKHDNILLYVKDPQRYTFNRDDIDRIRSAMAENRREVGKAESRSSQRPTNLPRFRSLAARTLVRAGAELDRAAAVTALSDHRRSQEAA